MTLFRLLIFVTLALIAFTVFEVVVTQRRDEQYRSQHHCVKKSDIEGIIVKYVCDNGEEIYR